MLTVDKMKIYFPVVTTDTMIFLCHHTYSQILTFIFYTQRWNTLYLLFYSSILEDITKVRNKGVLPCAARKSTEVRLKTLSQRLAKDISLTSMLRILVPTQYVVVLLGWYGGALHLICTKAVALGANNKCIDVYEIFFASL